ncbi:MAG: hypothetical protein LC634_05055 [Sphingomonadales bacterium]|nr:hypothetical protein [Sphingomonadales bacterium]
MIIDNPTRSSVFAADVELFAGNQVRIAATNLMQFDGAVTLAANNFAGGGQISVTNTGADIDFAQSLAIDVSDNRDDGEGGSVSVVSDNGTMMVDGTLQIDAGASGAGAFVQGGSVTVRAQNGGQLIANGDLNVFASANGEDGADANGGSIAVRALGGTINIGQSMLLFASGDASGGAAVGATGATGSGGNVVLEASGGGSLSAATTIDIRTDAFGGQGTSVGGQGDSSFACQPCRSAEKVRKAATRRAERSRLPSPVSAAPALCSPTGSTYSRTGMAETRSMPDRAESAAAAR